MVEIALILPIFFLLIFGFTSFAFVLFGFCNATYASRAAVRYAVLHGGSTGSPCTAAQVQTLVTSYLWGTPSAGITVTTNWNPDNSMGSTVAMKVAITYHVGIPFSSLNNIVVGTTAQGTILH